jgi:TIR domain
MTVDASKIFFSYAHADTQFVLELANGLRSAGVNLWIDQLDIHPGERWDSAIQNALTAAPCLLVVLSPESVSSQSVMDEVAFALQSNKRVVPVLYQRCDIPFRIQRLQYIDFTTSYDEGFKHLIKALKVGQPSHTTGDSLQPRSPRESPPEVPRTRNGLGLVA